MGWKPGRPPLSRLAGWALGFAVACGGEAPPDGPAACEGVPPFASPVEGSVAKAGFVRVRDVGDFTVGDDGVTTPLRQGLVQASFQDVSARTATSASWTQLSPVCLGRTSRPQSGGATRLDFTRLRVLGTGRGEVEALAAGPGTFTLATEPLLPGASTLQLVGTGADPGFPSFDVSIPPAAPMRVTSASRDAAGPLGLAPLLVTWDAAEGDVVLVSLAPELMAGAPDSGGQVLCAVADTGCLELPAAAAAFVLAAPTDAFTLTVERRVFRAFEPAPDAHLDAESASEERFTLERAP